MDKLDSIIKEVLDDWKQPNRSLRKKSKILDYKDLWETADPELQKFIEERIKGFNIIEDKLNILIPLLKKAKQETINKYQNKPSFNILYSTELAVDYLDDMIKMFK